MPNDDHIRETHYAAHLADDLHLGYFRCSKNGETLEVNSTLVELLEVNSEKELINSGVPSDLHRYLLDNSKKAEGKKKDHLILKVKTKKGNDIWIELSPRSVTDEHGNTIFHEGFVRNVSAQKSAEEKIDIDMTNLQDLNTQLLSALDRGSKFSEELIKESGLSSSAEIAEKQTTLNKKILLIDDDPKITDAFADFFSVKGLIVQSAENGSDALIIFQSFNPDVIISDIMMPGMDGLTLQEKFRDLNHEQKIILVTGDKSKEGAKELMNSMGITMLFKPVNISKDLWGAVKNLLQESSS